MIDPLSKSLPRRRRRKRTLPRHTKCTLLKHTNNPFCPSDDDDSSGGIGINSFSK